LSQGDPSRLLKGHSAIAAHLGIGNRQLQHMHKARLIPTWVSGGTVMATTGGLAEWSALYRNGKF